MPNLESDQHAASPDNSPGTLFDSVASSLAGPQESGRRLGAPESRTTVRIGHETFWDMAHEKYGVSGSAQVDAMLAILELNGLRAKPGLRNGKPEWIAQKYYAGKEYSLPAQSEIPALVKRFHERMANGGQPTGLPAETPGKIPPPGGSADSGAKVPDKAPPAVAKDTTKDVPGQIGQESKPPVATDGSIVPAKPIDEKDAIVPDKTKVGTDNGATVPDKTKVETDNGATGPDQTKAVPDKPIVPTDKGTVIPPNDALIKSAGELEKQHQSQVSGLTAEVSSQGWLGRFWDASKANIGGSSKSDNTFSQLWSNVVDSNSSSQAIGDQLLADNAKIAELKKAAADNDQTRFNKIYRDLTGNEFDPQKVAELKSKARLGDYRSSQEAGVDGIANLTALTAALVLTRRFVPASAGVRSLPLVMGADAVTTGGLKAAIKGTDQRYSDLTYDLASGGALGALAVPSEMIGTLATRGTASALKMKVTGNLLTERISTQGTGLGTRALSALTKYGVTGGAFGASAPVAQEAVSSQFQDRPFDVEAVKRESLIGLGTGLTLGTGMGFLIGGKGPSREVRTPRQIMQEPPAQTASEIRPPRASSEIAVEAAPPQVKVQLTGQNPDAVLRLKEAVSAGIKSDPELGRLLVQRNDEWVAASLDDAFAAQKRIDVIRNQLMPGEKISVGVASSG